jgi:hypothetical protein
MRGRLAAERNCSRVIIKFIIDQYSVVGNNMSEAINPLGRGGLLASPQKSFIARTWLISLFLFLFCAGF